MFSNKKGPHPLVGTVWDDPGWGKFIVKNPPDEDEDLFVSYVSGRLKGEQEYIDCDGIFDHFQFIRGSWRKHVQKK